MEPRKNDPCPCGSGKKYKNCCMTKYAIDNLPNTRTLQTTLHTIISFLNSYNFKDAIYMIKQSNTDSFELILIDILNYMQATLLPKMQQLAYQKQDKFRDDFYSLLSIMLNKTKNEVLVILVHVINAFFYSNVFGDALSAYITYKTVLKDKPIDSQTLKLYSQFIMLCLDPQINKPDEAAEYAAFVVDKIDHAELKVSVLSCYGLALQYLGKPEAARFRCLDAVKIYPSDMVYYNYGRVLQLQGDYEQAISYTLRALAISQDELNYLQLADCYRLTGKYNSAVENYQFAIKKCLSDVHVNIFTDDDFESHVSYATKATIDKILPSAFQGILQTCLKTKNVSTARSYLSLAKRRFPNTDWSFYEDCFEYVAATQEELETVRIELQQSKADTQKREQVAKRIIQQLINLQDSFSNINLLNASNWDQFESKMDLIIETMKKIDNTQTINNRISETSHRFNGITEEARKFLATAEVLYDSFKNTIIDFAPIITEYGKTLEIQLRLLIKSNVPQEKDRRMLGDLVYDLDYPLSKYKSQIMRVHQLRNNSTHPGSVTKEDVEEIRHIFFEEGLLDVLKHK